MRTALNRDVPIERPTIAISMVTEHILRAMMLNSPCERTMCLERRRRGPTSNKSM